MKLLSFFLLALLVSSRLSAFEVGGKEFVQTTEDKQLLAKYQELYERNRGIDRGRERRVPKIAHFVWLGPKEFPAQSVARVKRFIDLHPGWVVKFWTDMARAVPDARMKREQVVDFEFQHLGSAYDKSDNFGEKSHLLRYEILMQEGGVYLDHDVEVEKSLDPICQGYDFYAGLETPAPSILSTSVFPATHLIVAMPNHPILKTTIEWIEEHWDEISASFGGHDLMTVQARVKQHVVVGFAEGIQAHFDEMATRNIVTPSFEGIARHTHAMSWLEQETEFEQKVGVQLSAMKKESNRALYLLAGLAAVQLLVAAVIWMKVKRV